MNEPVSPQKIEANRQNAQKSTGPKTAEGKAASRLNALKHGLRSSYVVIQGRCFRENQGEFTALHDRLCADLKPVGALEEMLVDQIITTHWRLRRALKAESAEIALSVDDAQDARSKDDSYQKSRFFFDPIQKCIADPIPKLKQSSQGNHCLKLLLETLRGKVEESGEITDANLKDFTDNLAGARNELTTDIEWLRDGLRENPDGLSPSELKEELLEYLDAHIERFRKEELACKKREKIKETCLQTAQALPSPEVLNKCLRYIKPLERQLFQAMNQLERLQQRRLARKSPSPLASEISTA